MNGIDFIKFVGTGNDFVIFDNRKLKIKNLSGLSKKYCDRIFGIGADGLIAVEKSVEYDFRMRIFNPDGSEAEMCGNGSRCCAYFSYLKKIAPGKMCFETKAGKISASIISDNKIKRVRVGLTDPFGYRPGQLEYDGKIFNYHFIDTGVPHTVIFFNNLGNIKVGEFGKFVREHKQFRPAGTNVDFVKLAGRASISLRTYERGVEGETLACGTGATASAIISGRIYDLKPPISVLTRSGEKLKIDFKIHNDIISNVFLEGDIEPVFEGHII